MKLEKVIKKRNPNGQDNLESQKRPKNDLYFLLIDCKNTNILIFFNFLQNQKPRKNPAVE